MLHQTNMAALPSPKTTTQIDTFANFIFCHFFFTMIVQVKVDHIRLFLDVFDGVFEQILAYLVCKYGRGDPAPLAEINDLSETLSSHLGSFNEILPSFLQSILIPFTFVFRIKTLSFNLK